MHACRRQQTSYASDFLYAHLPADCPLAVRQRATGNTSATKPASLCIPYLAQGEMVGRWYTFGIQQVQGKAHECMRGLRAEMAEGVCDFTGTSSIQKQQFSTSICCDVCAVQQITNTSVESYGTHSAAGTQRVPTSQIHGLECTHLGGSWTQALVTLSAACDPPSGAVVQSRSEMPRRGQLDLPAANYKSPEYPVCCAGQFLQQSLGEHGQTRNRPTRSGLAGIYICFA